MSYTFCLAMIVAVGLGWLLGLGFAVICNLILWCAMWCAIAVAASLAIDFMMGLGVYACAIRIFVRAAFGRVFRASRPRGVVVPFVRP